MSSRSPTVSAVIPTYNRADVLLDALRSIDQQTMPVSEIVVVDDGSTDNTQDLLKGVQKVRYIRQKNAGPAAARNLGMREAQGEFVAFLDSDDLWVPEKIERQLDFMQSNPLVDLSFGLMANFVGLPSECTPEIKDPTLYNQLQSSASNVTDMFQILLHSNVVPTPTVMIRRSRLLQIGTFPENLFQAEDYALWLHAAQHCRWGFIDSILLLRRRHSTNLTNDRLARKKIVLDLMKSLAGSHISAGHSRLVHQKIAEIHYDLGSTFLKQQAFSEAYGHLRSVDKSFRPAFWYPKSFAAFLLSKTVEMLRN